MDLDFDLWAKEADSPFWLYTSFIDREKNKWVRTQRFISVCKKIADKMNLHFFSRNNDTAYFSLPPKLNATEDELIRDITARIEKIFIELLKNYHP